MTVIHGSMLVEGDRILEISDKDIEVDPHTTVVNGKGKCYLPGLVNTHTHAAMSLLRGFADDDPLQVWLEQKMWPNEAKFTAHDVKYGSLLSIVEMLKSGTTAFVDMYDHMDEVAQAVEQAGMRGCLARGIIAFGPDEVGEAKLQEAAQFVKNWHNKADGRITTMMSPHSPYTCPPAFIEKVVAKSLELNVPIHTHMSETLKEVLQNEEQYGKRPVAHLQSLGMFERPCLVAHAVHVNEEEMDILAQYDVRVSHNPISNLKLASGVAPVPAMLSKDVKVSLGTDSSASNNNLNLFEEIRQVALLHKGVSGDPTVIPAEKALKLGTVDGAKSIWLKDVGALQAGMKADFIAVDIDQPHFYPRTDIVSHLVYAATGQDVRDVWVDGKQIVKNREMLTLDEEKIMYEVQQCYERLMND